MIKRLIKEREQIACKACDFEITSDTLFTKRAFLIKKTKPSHKPMDQERR